MDKTAKYIEMCNKAKEVQKVWVKASGDFFYDHSHVKILMDRGFEKDESIAYSAVSVKCIPLVYVRFCWLPRQDQLQSIAGTIWGMDYTHPCTFGEGMVAHIWEGCPEVQTYYWSMKTWEQFWLAIVMKEKYQKVWSTTKKDWVGQQEE